MITALLPRSRTHAYAQLLGCLLIFYMYPGLIPDSRYFPLTVLAVAALLFAPSCASVGGRLARQRAPRLSSACGAEATKRWVYTFCSALVRSARRVKNAALAHAGVISCDTRAWYQTAASSTALSSSFWEKVFYAASAKLKALFLTLRRISVLSTHMLRRVCGYTTTYTSLRPTIPRLSTSGIRYVLALILWAVSMPFALAARQSRHLIWLLVMLAHFLSFTLGLTVVFPFLCMYGVVVLFMQQAVMDGITGSGGGL